MFEYMDECMGKNNYRSLADSINTLYTTEIATLANILDTYYVKHETFCSPDAGQLFQVLSFQ